MTSLTGSMALVYLFAVSFIDDVQLNPHSVKNLVDYEYDMNFTDALPGLTYESGIMARWAVPPSALRGLDGRQVAVKVTAIAENGSGVSFVSGIGTAAQSTETYLRCEVVNASCANSSILYTKIPARLTIDSGANASAYGKIILKSEIVESAVPAVDSAKAVDLMDSIKNALQQNFSGTFEAGGAVLEYGASAGNRSDGADFLDGLRPEGNPKDPLLFLRENLLISLAALAIVIVITGAFLLNTKD